MKQGIYRTCPIVLFLFWLVSMASNVSAELKLDSVYPTLGVLGQDLEVTVTGRGFDENTRVSMSLDVGHQEAIIGSVDTPGWAWDVTVQGDKAYLAAMEGGLQVIDISDPRDPQIIGSVDTSDYAMAVTVLGERAYVAAWRSGLQVIDISDPQNPRIIGSVVTPDWAYAVVVAGDKAYVTENGGSLQVIDISDPQNPQIIGAVDTPGYSVGVDVAGDKAYVADGESGLQVVDISDPQNPRIIGTADTPSHARRVTIAGDKAYVADAYSGLQVVDISDPRNPQVIGFVATSKAAEDAAVVGEMAYVADSEGGLQVVDISDPRNPRIIGSIDTPGAAKGVTVVGDYAYVADDDGGLQVIDISNPQNYQIFGSVDTPGSTNDVALAGDKVYAADGDKGLQVVDISDPSNPHIIDSVDTPGYAFDLAVAGDKIYVIYGSTAYIPFNGFGFCVIDISDPSNPHIMGSVDTPGYAQSVAVAGNKAYVADGASGLQVVDISDPQNLRIVGSVATSKFARDVAVSGDKAYVVNKTSIIIGKDPPDPAYGLEVIDISDPENPKVLNAVSTPGIASGVTVVGDRAYVADGHNGLQVIDISDPQDLRIIGSVDTPGFAKRATVEGNKVYLADGGSGLQVIDISDAQNPQITGSVDTPDSAKNLFMIGNKAYVADGGGGLIIVPIPIEILPVTVNSESGIYMTLPSPEIAGQYNLRVFNKSESDERSGAVTFSNSEDYQKLVEKKAIIVAGGGPYPGNNLWDATRLSSNIAYLSLLSQGYTRENIYYLSPKTDIDVDGDSTKENLSNAINVWAEDANELLLYMTDHGGDGTFLLNGTKVPVEHVTAATLDGWLDELQMAISGKVIFIYDACRSGSFLPLLTPPAGKERIVITSSQADERAWFINGGILSFSYQFWASVFLNANLFKSYSDSKNMMAGDQTPLIDSNGNGIGNEKEDKILANDIIIGRGRVAASVPPIIGNVSGEQTLYGDTSATLWVDNIFSLNTITRVWAIIIPPDYNQAAADIPIIELSTIDFVDPDQDGRYEGIYQGFTQRGTYNITLFAMDEEGTYSLPKNTTVTQEMGTDIYEDDDTLNNAGVITINDTEAQTHNFHDEGDQDWVMFYGIAGETYEIKTENLGQNCDTTIDLYNAGGTKVKPTQDDYGYGEGELLSWQCPEDGFYFVMVKQYYSNDFGSDTAYDLRIYHPTAAGVGKLVGRISDPSGAGIGGAVVKSDIINATAITLPNGYYIMFLPAGTYNFTAIAEGFEPKSQNGMVITDHNAANLDFPMSSSAAIIKGDINDDGKIDLSDAVLALKVVGGVDTAGDYVTVNADIDGDGKIGMEEVIYILQKLGEFRN